MNHERAGWFFFVITLLVAISAWPLYLIGYVTAGLVLSMAVVIAAVVGLVVFK